MKNLFFSNNLKKIIITPEKIVKIYSNEEVQMIKSKLNSSLENNDIKFIDEIFSFKY